MFASITPQTIKLYGSSDTSLKGIVRIVPEKSYPFKIIDSKAQVGTDIRFNVSEVNHSPQKSYILTIENLKQTAGRFYDTIYLMTDSPIKPKLSIRVYGKITTPQDSKPN